MLERIEGKVSAAETPIGLVPEPGGITLDGLEISSDAVRELLHVDSADWSAEAEGIEQFFTKFGSRLPAELWRQHANLMERLARVAAR
jgi:phosphoenolpyruvate carboxykinase (GTP)